MRGRYAQAELSPGKLEKVGEFQSRQVKWWKVREDWEQD